MVVLASHQICNKRQNCTPFWAKACSAKSLNSVLGTFTQAQSNTVSYQFNTTDAYTPATGSGCSYTPGYWAATSGSGNTKDSGGSSFYYRARAIT